MRKKKCYIYTRVSTMAQTEGYSLDAQQEKLRKYAEYKNLEIAGEYCDAGKSGKSIKGRPAFQQMMEDVASQKDDVSYVLVFKLSRFGRNAADVLKSLQLLMDYEVDLVSVDDAIDSSTQGGRLAEMHYLQLDLTEEQRKVCNRLLECRDKQDIEYATHAYIAGLYDAFQIMAVLFPDKWDTDDIRELLAAKVNN